MENSIARHPERSRRVAQHARYHLIGAHRTYSKKSELRGRKLWGSRASSQAREPRMKVSHKGSLRGKESTHASQCLVATRQVAFEALGLEHAPAMRATHLLIARLLLLLLARTTVAGCASSHPKTPSDTQLPSPTMGPASPCYGSNAAKILTREKRLRADHLLQTRW